MQIHIIKTAYQIKYKIKLLLIGDIFELVSLSVQSLINYILQYSISTWCQNIGLTLEATNLTLSDEHSY
jgi:hypothetical protein